MARVDIPLGFIRGAWPSSAMAAATSAQLRRSSMVQPDRNRVIAALDGNEFCKTLPGFLFEFAIAPNREFLCHLFHTPTKAPVVSVTWALTNRFGASRLASVVEEPARQQGSLNQ